MGCSHGCCLRQLSSIEKLESKSNIGAFKSKNKKAVMVLYFALQQFHIYVGFVCNNSSMMWSRRGFLRGPIMRLAGVVVTAEGEKMGQQWEEEEEEEREGRAR